MKKLFSFLLVVGLLAACNSSDSDNNDNVDVNSAPVTPGIDNVNGNMPDTSRTIRLNTPLPKDSVTGSAADTVPRR